MGDGLADKDTYFLKDGARRFDSRLWMHYNAVVVTPAMALTRPGAGSDYGIAGLDSEHRPLDGAKTYRLHVPPGQCEKGAKSGCRESGSNRTKEGVARRQSHIN